EAGDRIAEPWRRRHPQLRLNIHRHFAALPGLPVPHNDGTFLRRDTVVAYLERYARMLSLPIRYRTVVRAITKQSGGWRVETSTGVFAAEHLVIATGREKTPVMPELPGHAAFEGELLHAAHVGDMRRFEGKRVLVLGAGNSGTDVLNHLAGVATAKTWVSLRHGPVIIPTRLLGFPMHRLANLFAAMPTAWLDRLLPLTQRLAFGDLRRFGLKSHAVGAGTRLARDGITPALDNGFVAALKAGQMQIVPETTGFDGKTALLAYGERLTPDVVICATGYRSNLEDLVGDLDVLDAAGRPRLGGGQPHPRHPGLWFAGYEVTFQGYFYAAQRAARRIARGVAKDRRDARPLAWSLPGSAAGEGA
ncbi:MAG: NAD(P)/FAD-dependent oxidoreductase, partial [Pseudomonadota bacterium]